MDQGYPVSQTAIAKHEKSSRLGGDKGTRDVLGGLQTRTRTDAH